MSKRNKKYSIYEVQQDAHNKGIVLLSQEYENARSSLSWECVSCKTQWSSCFDKFKKLKGCWNCRQTKKRFTIKDMHVLAAKCGGLCSSANYINNSTPLTWICSNNHEWRAAPRSIRQGTWCPICANITNITENKVRSILEKELNNRFPTSRPIWLKNRRGNRMELDGYSKELKIAFEYDGEQHYGISFLGIDDFDNIKANDDDKNSCCAANGVILLRIPYWEKNNLENYIRQLISNLKTDSIVT